MNGGTIPRASIRARFYDCEKNRDEDVAQAVLLATALDSRRRTSLVFLQGSYSYKIDYIGGYWGSGKFCKLLKINGRGERI